AQIVFAAPEGETLRTPERLAAIATLLGAVAAGPEVTSVQPDAQAMQAILTGLAAAAGVEVPAGIVTDDGRIAVARATYAVPSIALTEEARAALETAVEAARATGLQVEIGGDVLQTIPEAAATEAIGVLVAA